MPAMFVYTTKLTFYIVLTALSERNAFLMRILGAYMINFFFRTYGCQANVADSQGIAQLLTTMGCCEVASAAQADLIIINTCAVREKAEQKLWSYIGKLAAFKRAKPYLKIGIIGCVASYKKQEIYTRFDAVSFVYGAREELPALQVYLADLVVSLETSKQHFEQGAVHKIFGGQDRDVKKLVEQRRLTLPTVARLLKKYQPITAAAELNRSFVNIMTGCNKYCSYCIVPFTRGREISFSMAAILERVRRDIDNGAKEITLIGQNVNSYIDPETGARFPELLRQVAEIDGDFWVRYISPHPQDMTEDLLDVMAAHRPKVCAAVHLPLQSGSNRILSLMNRTYTVEHYLKQVEWIYKRMPDVMLSTDIIVGFPTETEQEFLETMQVVEQVRYDLIYSFIYSPRLYTKAALMADDCSLAVKSERLERLQKRQTEIAYERNSRYVGKKLICLVEKRLEHGKLLARTEGGVRVVFDGKDDLIGTTVLLEIESTGPAQMMAKVAQDSN